jgi:hypothetical protein
VLAVRAVFSIFFSGHARFPVQYRVSFVRVRAGVSFVRSAGVSFVRVRAGVSFVRSGVSFVRSGVSFVRSAGVSFVLRWLFSIAAII